MATRVGVVLSGSGFYDGTEITEAVSILIALDRRGVQIICMAPDIPQSHTVNHLTGQGGRPQQNRLGRIRPNRPWQNCRSRHRKSRRS